MKIRHSEHKDVYKLKDRLRKSDRDELWAANHYSPAEALVAGIEKSELCYTLTNDKDKPIAMFGVADNHFHPRYGIVWLLASPELSKYKVYFLRESKRYLPRLLGTRFDVLCNFVDNRNTKSIKWLEWLGAAMALPAPYGIEKKLFRYFEIRRKNV